MSDAIAPIADVDFDEHVLRSKKPILVDFWAEWCGPCLSISSLLEEIAKEYSDKLTILKMNVDDNQLTPTKYGIRGLPTLMLFKNGDVHTKVGALTKSQLIAFLDSHL